MKTLTVRQFATIKRVAQNVNPLVMRKNKILDRIKKLDQEYRDLENEIRGHEAGIVTLTGGYKSEELVTKVIEDKVNDRGVATKVTKYVTTDVITYNEVNNNYELKELPSVCTCEACTCEEPQSDPVTEDLEAMPTEVEDMFESSIM